MGNLYDSNILHWVGLGSKRPLDKTEAFLDFSLHCVIVLDTTGNATRRTQTKNILQISYLENYTL